MAFELIDFSEPLRLFDEERAQEHKAQGMTAAAVYRKALLERARMVARKLASDGRIISADDVFEALQIGSDSPAALGNGWGSVFCGDGWICTGWTPSRRVSNHGRYIRLWRLK